MDQYIGKMLDNRYEILELIGSGGMANVYKAKCHRLNRMVAVKILKNDLAENADFRRRFRDESLAVAQLSHANIVSVYDVSRSGRHGVYRHGAGGRHHPEAVHGAPWQDGLAGGAALHHPDHAGAEPCPQPGHHPPDIKPQNIMSCGTAASR